VTVYATGVTNPSGLAFDASNNLYIANNTGGGTVSRVPYGGGVATPFATGFNGPNAMAFGPGGGAATTFATGFNGPAGLAFDGVGNLYVANIFNGTISVVGP